MIGSRVGPPIGLALLLGALGGCAQDLPTVDLNNTASPAPAGKDRSVLVVAVGAIISPKYTRELYGELLTHIGERLGMQAVISQRRTYAEVNHLLQTGEADIAFVCSGPYVRGREAFGLELLAVPVVGGKTTYSSHIIVNAASGPVSVDALRGNRFAFTDQHSFTGHLVPVRLVASLGQKPATFFSETFFTNGHDNSIRAVAAGLADAAAVDSLIWDFMSVKEARVTAQARVIWTSPPYGIPPVVVRPGLPARLKAELRSTFLGLHLDPRAARLLERLMIQRFVQGTPASYDSVRSMLAGADQ